MGFRRSMMRAERVGSALKGLGSRRSEPGRFNVGLGGGTLWSGRRGWCICGGHEDVTYADFGVRLGRGGEGARGSTRAQGLGLLCLLHVLCLFWTVALCRFARSIST